MKKLTIITAALFLLFSASAFTTTDADVSAKIKNGFQKDFSLVTDVIWQKAQDIYVATFKVKDQEMAAAYDDEGMLVSVSRYVKLSDLPLSISMALKNQYADYKINDSVIELLKDGTNYFITAENAKTKLKIKADAFGGLSVVSKTKK